ncbi:uncharacterized protein MYCFIDRAFT_172838 [Pseudocercospora fijiensis CIRAD86]|uniref:Uncharacterized protein n=1 Tax=Pseudocercospora fijiensis (strain CIRAD86) TaxID=383855 RepID=M3AGU2_PSEFD|nr:uncharacterized protein MYCFIDRAFT_172838 [Pseudocercospora fijiensis CIRAD86]EME83761.1 hypothetical protein MYCFIDRAFT_172838 [Pseudocercospora fijiensis CIRAD86]
MSYQQHAARRRDIRKSNKGSHRRDKFKRLAWTVRTNLHCPHEAGAVSSPQENKPGNGPRPPAMITLRLWDLSLSTTFENSQPVGSDHSARQDSTKPKTDMTQCAFKLRPRDDATHIRTTFSLCEPVHLAPTKSHRDSCSRLDQSLETRELQSYQHQYSPRNGGKKNNETASYFVPKVVGRSDSFGPARVLSISGDTLIKVHSAVMNENGPSKTLSNEKCRSREDDDGLSSIHICRKS